MAGIQEQIAVLLVSGVIKSAWARTIIQRIQKIHPHNICLAIVKSMIVSTKRRAEIEISGAFLPRSWKKECNIVQPGNINGTERDSSR